MGLPWRRHHQIWHDLWHPDTNHLQPGRGRRGRTNAGRTEGAHQGLPVVPRPNQALDSEHLAHPRQTGAIARRRMVFARGQCSCLNKAAPASSSAAERAGAQRRTGYLDSPESPIPYSLTKGQLEVSGAACLTRTDDLSLTRRLLYQLS